MHILQSVHSLRRIYDLTLVINVCEAATSPGGGRGGKSHMKQTGMLVVSLRGVNFGFSSLLGCSGQSANI